MLRLHSPGRAVFLLILAAAAAHAADAERDFSGRWILDAGASDLSALQVPIEQTLAVAQDNAALHCSATLPAGEAVQWTYALDSSETRYQEGRERRSSIVKWEGAALLVNTIVTGPPDYTVMDRWQLSPDRSVLTIVRQVVRSSGEREGNLVYRRETAAAPPTAPPPSAANAPAPAAAAPPAALVRPVPPARREEFVVPAGTRIPLTLRNAVDTKHSHEGDHIYLQTAYPIAENGRVVIPRGSFVNGTVTQSKAAGALKGKGELYIRFDSLVLPNGATRDFRSRLASADSGQTGEVDSKEGKVTGARNGSGDARTAAEGAGIGAAVGGVAGSAEGHALKGVGIGALAGAAGGLALARVRHRPDAVLPEGTTVEMVLDRDLVFTAAELSGLR